MWTLAAIFVCAVLAMAPLNLGVGRHLKLTGAVDRCRFVSKPPTVISSSPIREQGGHDL
jgi:hypothetical protein